MNTYIVFFRLTEVFHLTNVLLRGSLQYKSKGWLVSHLSALLVLHHKQA